MKKTKADKEYERLRELAEGMAYCTRISDETINRMYSVSKCHPSNYSRVISSDYFTAVLPRNSLTFT